MGEARPFSIVIQSWAWSELDTTLASTHIFATTEAGSDFAGGVLDGSFDRWAWRSGSHHTTEARPNITPRNPNADWILLRLGTASRRGQALLSLSADAN